MSAAEALALDAPALARRQAKRRAAWRRRGLVLALMSPWLVGFTAFFGYPLVMSAYLSFTHYDLLSSPRWVGTANYRFLFEQDQQVWPAVRNTLWLMVVFVPLQVLFALGVAMMLARARRGVGFFRTVFYLPALAPTVAATLAFVYLLNPATGPVNTILGQLGIEGPLWFHSPQWSKPALGLLGLWGIGNLMIIFLAAVIDVPTHLYESSELDGAGPWQRLRYVTLPSISPVILFAVVIGVIDSLQYFTQAYVAAGVAQGQAASESATSLGYPEDSTLFYPVLIYQQGFRYFNMGYASAMAMLLLVVALAVTLLILRSSRLWVFYQGAGAREMSAVAQPVALERRKPPAAVRRKRFLIAVADHSLLIAAAIMFLAPFVFIVLTSLMTNNQALSPKLWPEPFRWSNYTDVFRTAPIWRYALNTTYYAVLATIGVLVSSIPVAYALSRLRWKGRDVVFIAVLVAMMLPIQITVVPVYVLFSKLHLVGSLWPLIIPNFLGDAFSIFLLRQFFLTIPEEYSDAARVDGCGELRILFSVFLRLAKPAIAAVALFEFLFCFNDFFGPLLYTAENPGHWTLSLGLAQFRTIYQVQWNLTMAATVLFMAPVIVIFFLAQKAFVEGVTLTGVKG